MKRYIAILLALFMLLSLSACGEEKGVCVINNLGVDLREVDVMNQEGGGTTLNAGLLNGESGTVFMYCEDRVGYVRITATDTEGNVYTFPQVYLHDGVELYLEQEQDTGMIFATHYYDDSNWQHDGVYIPADAYPHEGEGPLTGEWVHPDSLSSIRFYGREEFTWLDGTRVRAGMYILNGDTVTLYFEGMLRTGALDEDGALHIENEDGTYIRQDG